jgi:hypothetical protein
MTERKEEREGRTILSDESFKYHLYNFVILEAPEYYNNTEDRFYNIYDDNIIRDFIMDLGGIKLTNFQKKELVNTARKYFNAYQRFFYDGWKYTKNIDEKSWTNLDIDTKNKIWFSKARDKNFIDKLSTFDIPSAPEAPNPIPQYLKKEEKIEENNKRLRKIIKRLFHNKGHNFTFNDVVRELSKIDINVNEMDRNDIKILKTLINRYTKEEKKKSNKYWEKEFEEYQERRKERISGKRK